MSRTFVIGTRGSRLALRQVELVRDALLAARPGTSIDVREIKTDGDGSTAPLSAIGGTGVFTKAIEDALIDRRVDIAVHSMKDLPARLSEGLTIGAVPEREDPRDALITREGRTLDDLPAGARIGTGSARRAVQLRALRGDLAFAEIRGNVETRIRKVEDGEYDATVLAMAGLRRLGLEAKAAQVFPLEAMIPAVGQACIAVEIRADDVEALDLVRAIDHRASRIASEAERAFLARLGAGCRLPVGAWAELEAGTIRLRGMLGFDAAADGAEPSTVLRAERSGNHEAAATIGAALAEDLIARAGPSFSMAEGAQA